MGEKMAQENGRAETKGEKMHGVINAWSRRDGDHMEPFCRAPF